MIIARIRGATRVIGKSQGYLGLPLRDEIRNTTVDGAHTSVMVTAWEPTPRFVVRDAAAVPEDSIGRMIVNQIDGAKKQIEALEKNIVVRELALKIVAGYDFRWDQPSYAGTSTITNFFIGTTA